MSAVTGIEWCDATVNMWWGCTKVSPGCAICYADSLAHRWGKKIWGKGKPREDHRAGATKLARKLNQQAEREGRRLRVFSASMSDWLDDEVPIEWLADLLALIHATPNLDWLLLTKRPENWLSRVRLAAECVKSPEIWEWLGSWLDGDAPHNVWIGTSVEDQQRANERVPRLLNIPARVHFLSCEPLLGRVDLLHIAHPDGTRQDALFGMRWHPSETTGNSEMPKVDWVIVGGESGQSARPMHADWVHLLRNHCNAAGVPFFFKQWGGRNKKAAGRLLDGIEHSAFPE